jgi:hypothetical protein
MLRLIERNGYRQLQRQQGIAWRERGQTEFNQKMREYYWTLAQNAFKRAEL